MSPGSGTAAKEPRPEAKLSQPPPRHGAPPPKDIHRPTKETTMDELPLFTEASLSELRGASPDRCRKLLEYYLEDVPSSVSRIEAALAAKKTRAIFEAAHSLKSSSHQIGALRLGQAAQVVEEAAHGSTSIEDIGELVRQMHALVAPTLDVVSLQIEREGQA